MHHTSYAPKLRRRLPLRATTLLIGLLISGGTVGCAPAQHPPLTIAFGGFNYTPDSSGLDDMLRQSEGASIEEQKSGLRMFADNGGEPQAKHKANYVLARLLQKQGDKPSLEEAVTRFRDAGAFAPLFERSQQHIGECGTASGDEKVVQDALSAVANNKTMTAKVRAQALYGLGQSALRANDSEQARKYFEQAQQMDRTSNFAMGATYYLASIQLHQAPTATAGDTKLMSATDSPNRQQAIEQYRKYLEAAPDGRFSEDIIDELANMPGFEPTQHDHELFAMAYYKHKHWQSALDEWHKAGNTSQWYRQGISMINSGKSAQGKALLMSGITNDPNNELVDDAATLLARAANHDGAVAVWKVVAEKSSRWGDIGLYNVGTRAATHEESLGYYRQVLTRYPTSKYAPESAWWLAWEDVKAGKSAQALAALQEAVTRYPKTRQGPRFAFWMGKVQERLGRKDLAKTAYSHAVALEPWSYYAYRAQSRLSALKGGHDEGWSTVPNRRVAWAQDTAQQWQWPEPPKQLAAQEGDTIATLTELRQWDECLELLNTADHKDAPVRAFLLAKMGSPLEAINAAVPALSGKPQRTELWQMAYPLLHAKQIASEAPRKHVDPFLVQGLIREESRYNAAAVSRSNALGLMQLLPGTAYGVAKRLGIKLNGVEDVHKPETNIVLGTDYLSYVQGRFNGNALYAVASYNGGPNAVARWTKAMPSDTDVFVENIPYKETRDYVRKVFGSYWNYRSIYGS